MGKTLKHTHTHTVRGQASGEGLLVEFGILQTDAWREIRVRSFNSIQDGLLVRTPPTKKNKLILVLSATLKVGRKLKIRRYRKYRVPSRVTRLGRGSRAYREGCFMIE